MPKHSNYFEEAFSLTNDHDPLVARLSECLYWAMRKLQMDREIAPPNGHFDYLYFFQKVIELWLNQNPEIKIHPTIYPLEAGSVQGQNWPDPETLQLNICKKFVDAVKVDSTRSGSQFNVEYAIQVIQLAFTGENEYCYHGPRKLDFDSDEDFDTWLSNFNS